MKKFILLVVINFSLLFHSSSQFQWGLETGSNINSRTGFHGLKKEPMFTFKASIIGNVLLSKAFILQPSIGYNPKGNRLIGLTFEDQLGSPIGTGDLIYRFDYFELSLPLLYPIMKKRTTFLGTGPYLSYAAGGKEKWENISGPSSNEPKKRNIPFGNNGYRRFDGGLAITISTNWSMKGRIAINYDLGLVNTYSSNQTKSYNRSVAITLGYLFN